MSNEEQIKRALAHLRAQKKPNVAAVARQFYVAPSTLSDRFRSKSVSREEATATTRLKLSSTQEETLMAYIKNLSDRRLSPTPRIARNLV
jgi:transposase-like protein